MATYSSILAWKSLQTEEPGRLHAVHGVTKRVGCDFTTEQQQTFSSFFFFPPTTQRSIQPMYDEILVEQLACGVFENAFFK